MRILFENGHHTVNQKTTKESNKSIQFDTRFPWLILKHPRMGAQRLLTKLKMAANIKCDANVPWVILKHPTRGAQKILNRK